MHSIKLCTFAPPGHLIHKASTILDVYYAYNVYSVRIISWHPAPPRRRPRDPGDGRSLRQPVGVSLACAPQRPRTLCHAGRTCRRPIGAHQLDPSHLNRRGLTRAAVHGAIRHGSSSLSARIPSRAISPPGLMRLAGSTGRTSSNPALSSRGAAPLLSHSPSNTFSTPPCPAPSRGS